jgi:hypothetical protein
MRQLSWSLYIHYKRHLQIFLYIHYKGNA